MSKTVLVDWLREEQLRWESLLDRIGEERMEQPGVSAEWSFKDLIAHLTGWNRWLADRLQAALRGEPKSMPPWPAHLEAEDEINAWIYETNRGRSLDEVLEESRRVLKQLIDTIESLPEDVRTGFIEPKFHLVWVGEQRFLPGEFFDHFYDDHEPDVRAWLARLDIQSAKLESSSK